MAKYVKQGDEHLIQVDLEDCEILINLLAPRKAHLEQQISYLKMLEDDGDLSDKQKTKLRKLEKSLADVNVLFDIIVTIGNHIN